MVVVVANEALVLRRLRLSNACTRSCDALCSCVETVAAYPLLKQRRHTPTDTVLETHMERERCTLLTVLLGLDSSLLCSIRAIH